MITLFIDTSTSDVSIAIVNKNKILSKIIKTIPNQHSIYTVEFINDCLKEAKLTPKEIEKKIKSIQKITSSPVFAISAIAGHNTTECLREISSFVPLKTSAKQEDKQTNLEESTTIKKTWSPLD